MKTPIQELIENLEVFLSQGMSYSEWKKLTYSGKTSIERYLDKEKEVIMRVYQDGLDNGFSNGNWKLEEYYNKTFNTKEKQAQPIKNRRIKPKRDEDNEANQVFRTAYTDNAFTCVNYIISDSYFI